MIMAVVENIKGTIDGENFSEAGWYMWYWNAERHTERIQATGKGPGKRELFYRFEVSRIL